MSVHGLSMICILRYVAMRLAVVFFAGIVSVGHSSASGAPSPQQVQAMRNLGVLFFELTGRTQLDEAYALLSVTLKERLDRDAFAKQPFVGKNVFKTPLRISFDQLFWYSNQIESGTGNIGVIEYTGAGHLGDLMCGYLVLGETEETKFEIIRIEIFVTTTALYGKMSPQQQAEIADLPGCKPLAERATLPS